MKFSEMPYARPDLDELKQQLQALTDQLKSAPDYASCLLYTSDAADE